MKTYDDLIEMGLSHTEAMARINKYPSEYKMTEQGNLLEAINALIGVPDIALNDYDYLEDEIFW